MKPEKEINIAAVGDNCMDVYEALGAAYPGGNPVNVAVYARRLGAHASYTGAVGTDTYGSQMLAALQAKGVDTSHVQILPGKTAVTQVEVTPEGDRILGDYDPGVLESFKLSPKDIDFLCRHDLIVSGIWGMIDQDLPTLKARGVPIAFDFATKLDHSITQEAIHHVDYAFFAYDGGDTPFIRDYARRMHAKGSRLVIVTLGEKGSLAYDGTAFTTFGIVPCPVVDTMGAGDSYIAGTLVGLMQGLPLIECMEKGAANSATTIAYTGAW